MIEKFLRFSALFHRARVGPTVALVGIGVFTLLETLIAATMLTVALLSTAALVSISARANQSANATSLASVLAQQKVEQLRGLAWSFDASGFPVTDTTSDLTVTPERPIGGSGLAPSPPRSLQQNAPGYFDFLDAQGRSLGSGATTPGAVYTRRWSVEPLPADPDNTLVLQVLVTRSRNRGSADSDSADRARRRFPDEARIVTVRARKGQ